jgi:uncharacterized repeat protein (TIGR02059 family)
LSNGIRIRIEAAKAISAIEINAGIPANAGISRNADPLFDFFAACSAAISGFRDVTVPTITSRAIGASRPSTLVLTASEGLAKGNIPENGAFAVVVAGAARAVTKVVVDGPFVYLTLASAVTVGQAVTVAYTQPTTVDNRLTDGSDNYVASFTAAAVVNGTV